VKTSPESARIGSVRFTGERIVPELANYFFREHIARYRFAAEYVRSWHRVLDVGCGDGYGTYYLCPRAQEAVGIDISHDAITLARKKYRNPNLDFRVLESDDWPFSEGTFDILVFFEVFEHVAQPQELLREARRVLKDDGLILISTPNRDVYGENLPDPYHVKEYSLHEFVGIVRQYFGVKEVFGQRNQNQFAKRLNFWIARRAMQSPWVLEPYNWLLSKRPKKYLEPGYFDRQDLHGNYFSREQPESADYFLLVGQKIADAPSS
jgi:SAM-dependent methyltransferase